MASNRGFAGMDKEKQKEIAAKGGSKSTTHRTSTSGRRGAAGSTDAAKRGGMNSHRS